MKKYNCLFLILGTVLFQVACPSVKPQTPDDPENPSQPAAIAITSTAFTQGNSIPARYTCSGTNISPPLAWGEPPAGTKSFAILMDDPDASPRWVHWIIYNIPGAARGLPENIVSGVQLADGSLQGKNSWNDNGYGGPCPPTGMHHYYFKLYALDAVLALSAGATNGQLQQAMVNHILAYGELMGTFSR